MAIGLSYFFCLDTRVCFHTIYTADSEDNRRETTEFKISPAKTVSQIILESLCNINRDSLKLKTKVFDKAKDT
ncbi:unnamed protein product [Sphenostylis stenocarpa]|uniref:Uncharacterized protein n=1 Tax=Sphenostylis stenocarpa TaxID=92480 RepID=A0AA86TC15_9FABA|nr:unnamed protein product [Sphenostylis stenocarpa]